MDKRNNLSWKMMVPILCILGAFFVVGIFYDLQFSKFIVNEASVYAAICATFGFLPLSFLATFCGTALLKYVFKKEFKGWVVLIIIIFAFVLIGYSCFCAYNYIVKYYFNSDFVIEKFYSNSNIVIPKWLRYVVIFLIEIGSALFAVFFVDENKEKVLVLSGYMLVIFAIEGFVMNLALKQLWGRPRFRMLNDDPSFFDYYRAVYEPAFIVGRAEEISSLKPYFELSSDYFKSFPSGHSVDASCGILLFFIPSFNKKNSNNHTLKLILFIVGALWMFNIMFSRIVQGAHFITDVTAGGALGCLIVMILSIFLKKFKIKE